MTSQNVEDPDDGNGDRSGDVPQRIIIAIRDRIGGRNGDYNKGEESVKAI
jgi:hypothetical protein